MTGTSVTQAAGLFMGAANVSVPAAANGANGDGFSQIMSRTTKDSAGQMQGYQQNDKAAAAKAPVKVERSGIRENTAQETEKTSGTAETQNKAAAEISDEAQSAVEEAVSEVKDAIEEELGISEEELEVIMSQLGLTGIDLLQPENMQAVVIAAAGEGDGLSILTNEGLYQSVQFLTGMAEETMEGLQEELGLDDGAFGDLLMQMEAAAPEETVAVPEEEAAEIPVIVSQKETGDEASGVQKKDAAENGNTTGLTEDAAEVKETVHTQTGAAKESSGGEKEAGTHQESGSHFLQDLAKPGVDILRDTFSPEQAEIPFETVDTHEVMEQITEYVKMEARPEMTELELRLHPETLGTLHIHLTSKEGVVTAQFTTENEAVRAVLEAQAAQLKENLSQQGVKVEAVEVTIASHGFERSFADNGGAEAGYQEPKKRGARRIQLDEGISLEEMELTDEERIAAEMMAQNGNTVDYMA